MPYDFRPYVRQTEPIGRPGKGVYLDGVKLYMYPDHGYIDIAAIPQRSLPLLSQPFADSFQGMQILAGIWRMMWKEAKKI
jgi:hypothetical protein